MRLVTFFTDLLFTLSLKTEAKLYFLCVTMTMPLLQVVQRGLLPVGGSLLPQHRGGRGERGEAGREVNISTHVYTLSM